MCEFEILAKELVEHTLEYEHYIVFCSMFEQNVNDDNKLQYLSIEEICSRTNLHSRHVMKYVMVLLQNKFLQSYVKIIDKKRTTVYGVCYATMLNFSYAMLQMIYDFLSQKNDFWCAICQEEYSIEKCLNNEMLTPQCPCDTSHTLSNIQYTHDDTKSIIQHFLNKIDALRNRTPKRLFVDYFKRVRLDDTSSDRVVVKKSSIS